MSRMPRTPHVSLHPAFAILLVLLIALLGCSATAPTSTPTPPTPTPRPTATVASSPGPTTVTFPGQATPVKAYQVVPAGQGPFPALIVIHENRGLTEHIKDVARRFAAQGYVALAPDLLSRVGGRDKFATDDEAVAGINGLSREGVVEDLQSTFDYLGGLAYVQQDRIGVIGYCWGGGNSLLMATRVKGLRTTVVYYGPNPSNLEDVANISGPMLGIYGELDTRITVAVAPLAEAMQRHGRSFEYKVYPGAAHAFFNDTGARYNAEAAADAWQVTLAFLQKNLK